jgi:uncharacterized protein DUF4274
MGSEQPRWEYLEDPDDDRDYTRELIGWLSDKDPDVWHYVAGLINWDNGEPVIDWIVSQPGCYLSTACEMFWKCDPVYIAGQGPGAPTGDSAATAIFQKIVARANAGEYQSGGPGAVVDNLAGMVSRYKEAVRGLPDGVEPHPVPPEFLAPMRGPSPHIPDHLKAENNRELRQCLNALGSAVHSAEELAWLEKQRPAKAKPIRVAPPQPTRAARIFGVSLIVVAITILVVWAVIGWLYYW